MRWLIEIHGHFSSAHQLTRNGDPIEPLHGHNYRVDLFFIPDTDPDEGGVTVDFHALQATLKHILETLHMKNLNDTEPFRNMSPSAENIARYIAQSFISLWDGPGKLHAVRVWEDTDRNITFYPD